MADSFSVQYNASPTGSRFHKDPSRIRALMGPVGSGKTVTCMMELVRVATLQAPNNEGVRDTKWAVIRATYPELIDTTLATFKAWFGDLMKVRESAPISAVMKFPLSDGTMVHIKFLFMALDNVARLERALKSNEITGAFMNEAPELRPEVLSNLRDRIGRYPPPKDGAPVTRAMVIMDANPPPKTNWFYELFEEQRPNGHVLYVQPPAVIMDKDSEIRDLAGVGWSPNPDAENIDNLDGGFNHYLSKIQGQSNSHVRNRYGNEYGTARTSGRVYTNFSPARHVVRDAVVVQGRHVYLGFDWGLTPAMVAFQLSATGTLTALRELTPKNITFDEFLRRKVLPLLRSDFYACPIVAVGDPTGVNRSDLDKRSRFSEMRKVGIAIQPSRTNSIIMRKEAIDYWLDRPNGFAVDPEQCPVLYEGLLGGYQYTESKGGAESFKKNFHSHVMDAAQYVAFGVKMGYMRGGSDALGIPRGSKHPGQAARWGGTAAGQRGKFLWA